MKKVIGILKGLVAVATAVFVFATSSLSASAKAGARTALFHLPGTPAATWAHLEHVADHKGVVPVIVALNISAVAPRGLAPEDLAAQRASIAKARGALLDELGGSSFRGLKVSDDMPLVALQAAPSQLAALKAPGLVAAVTQDHEIALNDPVPAHDATVASTPPHAGPVSQAGGSIQGTSSNGASNQLSAWWDWYRIGVDKAKSAGYTGAGQTVAVLDTGVDLTHPWLAGKIVAQACFSTYTVGGTTGGCPNGTNVQYGAGAATFCTYSTTCAHGTHSTQTAAGTWGVASGATIIAVQVFHRGATGAPTYWESDLVWALSYVYSLGSTYHIAAVNMSLGGRLFTGYCDNAVTDGSTNATYLTGWINALKGVNIATVVSSGNDDSSTSLRSPSCISNAVSVGNTTYDTSGYDAVYGNVSFGSNSNGTLDLLAPGTDICSAVPYYFDSAGMECSWIGTSMAAPHVAGALAVLRQYRPAALVDTLVSALARSGPSVSDSRNGVIRTRINVWTALGLI